MPAAACGHGCLESCWAAVEGVLSLHDLLLIATRPVLPVDTMLDRNLTIIALRPAVKMEGLQHCAARPEANVMMVIKNMGLSSRVDPY